MTKIATAIKKKTLIDLPMNHGAVFGVADADRVQLPVIEADPDSDQSKLISCSGPSTSSSGRVCTKGA